MRVTTEPEHARQPTSAQVRPRVLLVDDDRTLLYALEQVLRARLGRCETTIDVCDSAADAIERLHESDCHVLVSDYFMPHMDGLALLERARELRPHCITLLITGRDDRELTVKALRSGVYDFIQKPVDGDYFVACIGRALETAQLRREVDRQQRALVDYTEKLERVVDERTRELREANRIKDEFLATLSHELRTPLTSILGWSRLLLGGKLDERTRTHALESVARNAESQAQLIDDLLDVSRIIMGKLRLEMRSLDIVPVLDAALAVVQPAAQAKNIRIDPTVRRGPLPVRGDPNRLQQVFWNLLSNAVKFTPEGGRVEIHAEQVRNTIEICVQDDGIGIPREFLPLVFDRFRQGDVSARWSRRGLGLGLAISRHLVELHGGNVTAASDGEGMGAAFTVALPALNLEEEEGRGRSRSRRTSRQLSGPESRCLAGARVQIVEDEPDAREMLRVILEQAGATVIETGSVAEAFAAFEREPPDLLLCDIGLPDGDGHGLLERIRALPIERGGRVPAIALTAYAKGEDCQRALRAGFQLHLAKPGPPNLVMIAATVMSGTGETTES